jgi:hypothetical protein
MRLAVVELRELREFLSQPARRGGLKARQRRRFQTTVKALRDLEANASGNPVPVPSGVARNILWCLAQVPKFLDPVRRIVDAVLGPRDSTL